MGLRQKSPCKPTPQNEENTPRSPKKRTRNPRSSTVQLVASDPALSMMLDSQSLAPTPLGMGENVPTVTAKKVEEAKQSLGKLEQEVMAALFPDSGQPKSFEEIGAELGMTPKQVQDIADNALRGLRGPRTTAVRVSTVWN